MKLKVNVQFAKATRFEVPNAQIIRAGQPLFPTMWCLSLTRRWPDGGVDTNRATLPAVYESKKNAIGNI